MIQIGDGNIQSNVFTSNPFADMVSVEPVGHHPYLYFISPKEPDVINPSGATGQAIGYDIDDEEHVLVPMSVFRALERDERELIALNSAGVDNWSGRDCVNWDYVETGKGEPTHE